MIADRIAALEAQLRGQGDETSLNLARRDLRYWQTRQITAELAPIPDGEVVDFGTRVTFRLGGQVQSLAIVGYDEADPATGSIAFSAPLSRALMGAEPGEILPFQGREGALVVVSIEVAAS
jgi:transcription elongation GreA/GreB family factor